MYKIGDLIIYSGHGICRIDNICERNFAGSKKNYYVLHPIENSHGLTIHAPVDNEENLLKLMKKDEAEKILESFRNDGAEWIEKSQLRNQVYSKIVNSGNRMEIAQVANTLIRKKNEVERSGKKFYEHDGRLLRQIENILFEELAIILNTTAEEIQAKIHHLIRESEEVSNNV